MTFRAAIAFAALLGADVIQAQAQTQPQQLPPAAVDSKACSPGDRLKPGSPNPTGPSAATTGESLSDKLARTDGVICPPNVDPGIRAPTPEAGKTPVIPPPGAPGGDPTVRPK